jgi:aminoglycoside phosphotransferase (APT) family kinase protein
MLPPLINEPNLRQWLTEKIGGENAPLEVIRVGDGRSNETFLIKRGKEEYILRRPPRGPLPPTAHDVLREWRVLSALYGSALAVPRPVIACQDPEVTGAPFYLMQKVEGYVIRDQIPPIFDNDIARQTISCRLIEMLVTLHSLDFVALGLGDLGRPEGYLARQLKRWSGLLEHNQTRSLPDLEYVTAWLERHLPASPSVTIVHGDYRLDNVIVAPDKPEIVAVLDWEMATLGDPLADLGYTFSFWVDLGEPLIPYATDMGKITSQPGFLSKQTAANLYEQLSGRAVANLRFYEVLAIWKLAILREGNYKRYLAGTTDNDYYKIYAEAVPHSAKRARQLTESWS